MKESGLSVRQGRVERRGSVSRGTEGRRGMESLRVESVASASDKLETPSEVGPGNRHGF